MSTFDSLDETFDITPNKGDENNERSHATESALTGSNKTESEIKRSQPAPLTAKEKRLLKLTTLGENREDDFAYQRGKLYDLAEKLTQITEGAIDTAEETSHPRAWEVSANAAKTAAEVVEKLGDLHAKMNALEKADGAARPSAVQQGGTQQNIFLTGSTKELMEALKTGGALDKPEE